MSRHCYVLTNDFVDLSPNKSEDRICFAYYNAVTWILNLFA